MYQGALHRTLSPALLACLWIGCDRTPIVEVITDTQQDLDHVHRHQHGQEHRHDHVHDSFSNGSHSHAHRHMHRHVDPPNGGLLVSLMVVGNHVASLSQIEDPHLEIVPQLPGALLFYLYDFRPGGEFTPLDVDSRAFAITISDDQSDVHEMTGIRQEDAGYRAELPSALSGLLIPTSDAVRLKLNSAELGDLSFFITESLIYQSGKLDVVVD